MRRADRHWRHELAAIALSALYPSTCPLCKSPSNVLEHSPLCMTCWNSIKGYYGPSCTVCATPLVSEYSRVCKECLLHRPHFSSVLSFGIYSGALKEAIHLLKFSGIKRLAKPLGRFLYDIPVPRMDGIIPVPLSKKTLRQRGFNQTLLLARVLSRRLGIPVCMDVLYKKEDTLPQIGLGAKERSSNLRKAFEVVGNVTDKRVILLDDVITTGATARECSKTLIRAGAKEVVVVTLARSSMD